MYVLHTCMDGYLIRILGNLLANQSPFIIFGSKPNLLDFIWAYVLYTKFRPLLTAIYSYIDKAIDSVLVGSPAHVCK